MDQSESPIFTFHSDDVTKNPKRLVPSVMGFARAEIGMFLRARVKKGFFFAMMKLMLKCRFTCGGVDILFFQCKMLFCNKTSCV